MKKFAAFIITAFIISVAASFTANAQFVDRTERGKTITIWGAFNKSFGVGKDGYSYVHISKSPVEYTDGTINAVILSLSLGDTEEECRRTLDAYRKLLRNMADGERREIFDVKSEIVYEVVKREKNKLVFSGTVTEQDGVTIHNNGILTGRDINQMLKGLWHESGDSGCEEL